MREEENKRRKRRMGKDGKRKRKGKRCGSICRGWM